MSNQPGQINKWRNDNAGQNHDYGSYPTHKMLFAIKRQRLSFRNVLFLRLKLGWMCGFASAISEKAVAKWGLPKGFEHLCSGYSGLAKDLLPSSKDASS